VETGKEQASVRKSLLIEDDKEPNKLELKID